jgi:hypothetical protein
MKVLSSTVADELETTPEDPFKLVKTPTKSHILVFFFSDSSTLVCVVGGGEELVCTGDPDRYLNARIDLSHASAAVSFVHETAYRVTRRGGLSSTLPFVQSKTGQSTQSLLRGL